MIKTFPFRLDIEKEYNYRMYSVNSNDLKTVKFTFVVTDNGIPLDLTGLTVRIAIRKPDKKAVWQECTVTNAPKGEVEVILESQAYIKKGEHEAELMLYKGNDTVAITQKFHYRAAEGIMSDKSLKSETVLGPIDQKLAEVEETIKDIRDNGTGIDAKARQDIQSVTTQLAEIIPQIGDLDATKADNERIDNIIAQAGNDNTEIVDARQSSVKNKSFGTVRNRLEDIENSIGFPATNIVTNSSFNNGASGWGSSSSSFSTGNGIATMVALKQNDYIRSPNINRIADNKYYVFSRYKSTSDKVGIHSNAVLLSGSTHSGNGQFERKSVIFPTTSSMENWVVGIIDTRQSGWDSIEVDYVGVINLTATFGIGKEPTLEKMDEIMSKYPNGHFENTVSPLFGAKELYEKISTVQSTTFVDQDTSKTYSYGFKQEDGHLVFVYEEVK